ncbi:ImmA/IrrE family metallo-endopeptidase [Enterococcus sp. LJL120]
MQNKKLVIAKLATEVRKELNMNDKINIDMLKVLEELDVTLEENSYRGAEGTIRLKDGKYIISLERSYNENNPRDKFTLAHELGHLFLHINEDEESKNKVFTRNGTTQAEYDANEFAANFLMPEGLFRKTVEDLKHNNMVDVNDLARKFGVSYDAALTRGRFLGVFKW